jgi:hypothetical protein
MRVHYQAFLGQKGYSLVLTDAGEDLLGGEVEIRPCALQGRNRSGLEAQ